MDSFTKITQRKFFFLTIYSYLCNKQSGSLKWQNKVEYRSSLVSLSLPLFIDKQYNDYLTFIEFPMLWQLKSEFRANCMTRF